MAHDTYSPLRCLPATCPMPHAPCPCPLCSQRDVAFAYSCAQFLGIGSSDSNFVPMIVVAAVPLFRLPLVVRLIRIHILLPCRAVPYLATPPAAQHTLYTFSICHLKLAFFSPLLFGWLSIWAALIWIPYSRLGLLASATQLPQLPVLRTQYAASLVRGLRT